MFGTVTPVERGCGTRKKGGLYWELGLGEGGRPLEDFCFCPADPLPGGYVVPKRGVGYLDVTDAGGITTTHLVDRIGLEHYPNVLDFLEETRRFGLSRRLPGNVDVGRLNSRSRILIVHDRARVLNWPTDYLRELGAVFAENLSITCPKFKDGHAFNATPLQLQHERPALCDAAWTFDIDPASIEEDDAPPLTRVTRTMPSFSYRGHTRPDVAPRYEQGIIASFPCGRLAVVKDDDNPGYAAKLDNLRTKAAGALSVEEVDQ